jgi:hypothetical protein
MIGLRAGHTLRKFWLTRNCPRFKAYCEVHPEYAREVLPLAAANQKAANLRKGDRLRTTPHCRSGIHLMVGDNVLIDGTHGRKRCLACRRASSARAPAMQPEVVEKVRSALQSGTTIGQICFGKPIGGGKIDRKLVLTGFKVLKRYRRENPEFDRFVMDAISRRIYCPTAAVALNTFKYEWHPDDDRAIRAMLPERLPDKDDIVNDIVVSLLEGRLDRARVKDYVKRYVTAHYRMFPTDHATFAGRKLVSLDAKLYEDSATTRGDTVSRGLWD